MGNGMVIIDLNHFLPEPGECVKMKGLLSRKRWGEFPLTQFEAVSCVLFDSTASYLLALSGGMIAACATDSMCHPKGLFDQLILLRACRAFSLVTTSLSNPWLHVYKPHPNELQFPMHAGQIQ
jgi:hypothetical protein